LAQEFDLPSGSVGRLRRYAGDIAPGRLKLSTKPQPTGSELAANTIGIVVVARFAASTGADPDVAMTSTPSLTNSAA
jgi:hypothetical protein